MQTLISPPQFICTSITISLEYFQKYYLENNGIHISLSTSFLMSSGAQLHIIMTPLKRYRPVPAVLQNFSFHFTAIQPQSGNHKPPFSRSDRGAASLLLGKGKWQTVTSGPVRKHGNGLSPCGIMGRSLHTRGVGQVMILREKNSNHWTVLHSKGYCNLINLSTRTPFLNRMKRPVSHLR